MPPRRSRFDPLLVPLVALVLGALFVYFVLPAVLVDQADFDKAVDRYKAENDVRGTGIQLLGGLVLVVGAYFTARTFALNREGQITDRFSTAVDHLGSDKLATCLGGLYALERISRSDASQHGPIMEILSAFARDEAARRKPSQPSDPAPAALQAALDVIGRRRPEHDPPGQPIDFASAHLRGASLRGGRFPGVDLSRVDLSGGDLRQADLTGANLEGADLGGAQVDKATFDRADISLLRLIGAEGVDAASFAGARQEGGPAVWPLGMTAPV
jgi:Pentapeptide repeats (8 copies)